MVPVRISVNASDDLGDVMSRIVSVTCNEPFGRGRRPVDYQITGPLTLNLRATRLGQNRGRVYTILVETVDNAGQTAQAQVRVTVPHSRGR
jgi:hypothetical protein